MTKSVLKIVLELTLAASPLVEMSQNNTLELVGLLLLCPIKQDWAVIGRADKYLSPAALEKTAITPKTLEVTLRESGPLVSWSASGRPASEKLTFTDLGGGFWKADMPVRNQAVQLEITR